MNRFSLQSLLLFSTIIAVICSAWVQHQQSGVIAQLNQELETVEQEHRIQARIIELFKYLSPDSHADSRTIALLKKVAPAAADLSVPEDFRLNWILGDLQLVDVEGGPGGLEVLSLSNALVVNPGSDFSVNVLFYNQKVVDVLVRETGTRYETHDVEIHDATGDGRKELVLVCTPGFFSGRNTTASMIYVANENGFSLQE